ncbi:hypothetical protein J6590_069950 [Homalodisca vitripennis]|nr:hypothetical protein J6590_069950 [Homalodisca vitripennis]
MLKLNSSSLCLIHDREVRLPGGEGVTQFHLHRVRLEFGVFAMALICTDLPGREGIVHGVGTISSLSPTLYSCVRLVFQLSKCSDSGGKEWNANRVKHAITHVGHRERVLEAVVVTTANVRPRAL